MVQFSCLVMSSPLLPHGLQHARLPCLSPSPGTCSNSCPLSQWCHPTISSSVVPFSCLQSFPTSESVLPIRWPKYWSFSISPSNEFSGLISFRIDWVDLAVQGTLKSLLQPHSLKASILEKEMAAYSSIFAWRIPMDREAWQATVHGVAKTQTQLSD